MRRALTAAAAALSLALLASCTDEPADSHPSGEESTWSVACASGTNAIEGVGEVELDCLGDEAATTVGANGKPLVVVLWATWCGPCREEAPEIQAFYEANSDQVDVLGVDTADLRDSARWFAEDFGLTYPSVFDPEEAVRIGLGVPALPGIALVAADGTVLDLIVKPGVTADSLAAAASTAFDLELV
ncbi:TlpA disulfide reductase family protein [Glycomyces sp. NPDC046736]|uniref:TlpA family protein disulfide reductase n=1 Tax=Glycomyces sp. NPDC046736 TaxID=3155615 RepID=UPI0033D6144E